MTRALFALFVLETKGLLRTALRRLPTRRGSIAVVALIALVLGVPYAAYLSVTQEGNFEGQSIAHVTVSPCQR